MRIKEMILLRMVMTAICRNNKGREMAMAS